MSIHHSMLDMNKLDKVFLSFDLIRQTVSATYFPDGGEPQGESSEEIGMEVVASDLIAREVIFVNQPCCVLLTMME